MHGWLLSPVLSHPPQEDRPLDLRAGSWLGSSRPQSLSFPGLKSVGGSSGSSGDKESVPQGEGLLWSIGALTPRHTWVLYSPGYLETSYPHLHLSVLVPKGKTLMACTHLHSRAGTQA